MSLTVSLPMMPTPVPAPTGDCAQGEPGVAETSPDGSTFADLLAGLVAPAIAPTGVPTGTVAPATGGEPQATGEDAAPAEPAAFAETGAQPPLLAAVVVPLNLTVPATDDVPVAPIPPGVDAAAAAGLPAPAAAGTVVAQPALRPASGLTPAVTVPEAGPVGGIPAATTDAPQDPRDGRDLAAPAAPVRVVDVAPAAPAPAAPAPAPPAAPGAEAPRPASRPVHTPLPALASTLGALRGADGDHTLRMSLHPADLGTVRVDVHVQGDLVSVQVQAESAGAAEAVRLALPELRAQLETAGLRVDDLQVRQEAGAAPDDQRPDRGANDRTRDERGDDRPAPRTGVPTDQPADRAPTPTVTGRLDLRL